MFTAKMNKSDNGYGTSHANASRGYGYGYKVACVACGWLATLAVADNVSAAPTLNVAQGLTAIASGDTLDLGEFALTEPVGVALVLRNFGSDTLVFDFNPTELGLLSGVLANFSADLTAGSIAPGGLAILPIGFTPDGPGPISVEVLINSNDPVHGQFSVTLTAEVTVPSMSVSRELTPIASGDTFDLGEVGVADTVGDAFVIRNNGTGPLVFDPLGGATLTQVSGDIANGVVNTPPNEIAPGGFAIVTFSFDVVEAGTTEVRLTMNTNDPDSPQYDVFLQVAVLEVETPSLLVSFELETLNPGDAFDLGTTEVGDGIGEAFTVRNIGDATLNIGGAIERVTLEELTAGDVTDFAVELNATEIAAGGFAVLTAAFAPTSAGPREVALTIHSNDPTHPEYTFTLLAEGLEAEIAPVAVMRVEKNQIVIDSGDTYDLGETLVGHAIGDALAIYNDGDAPLVITSATSEGDAGFEYELPFNEEIISGAPAAMTVTYTGTTAGEYAGTLTMLTNDPQRQAYTITFTTTVIDQDVELAPRIQVSAEGELIAEGDTYDLGTVQPGFTKLQSFIVTNVGNATLHLDAAAQLFELSDGNVEDVTAVLSVTEIAPDQDATLFLAVNILDTRAREFEIAIDSDDPRTPEYSFFVTVNTTTDCNENGIDDAADIANGTSEDCNGNGMPDECETDSDGDGVIDGCDRCPGEDDLADSDLDGVTDCLDNCPGLFNPSQSDVDGDGIGDGCDVVIDEDRTEPSLACGAGGMAMLPMMMMGLCGMGRRRYGSGAGGRA